MHVGCRVRAHEERVMVDVLVATINMGKQGDVSFAPLYLDIKEVRWDDIEVLGIEFDQSFKLCSADAVVTELEESVSM